MINQFVNILLFVTVIAWSLWFGALMYEVSVITPLWSGDLPTSVVEWNSRPNYVVNPTPYYVPVALTTVLSSILVGSIGWRFVRRRSALFLSAVCSTSALVFTLLYFFSRNEVLFRNGGIGLSGEQISITAYEWIFANWVRAGIMAVGFVAAIRAYGSDTRS